METPDDSPRLSLELLIEACIRRHGLGQIDYDPAASAWRWVEAEDQPTAKFKVILNSRRKNRVAPESV